MTLGGWCLWTLNTVLSSFFVSFCVGLCSSTASLQTYYIPFGSRIITAEEKRDTEWNLLQKHYVVQERLGLQRLLHSPQPVRPKTMDENGIPSVEFMILFSYSGCVMQCATLSPVARTGVRICWRQHVLRQPKMKVIRGHEIKLI